MRYAAFLLPLRRELKFGEVGGGGSRARRTLPRRGKPCQGRGKETCVEPRTSLFLWLPLTRSRADVRARSEAESFAPQGQALSGARERKLCGTANLFFFRWLPLRRELKFGEVGGGSSRARRTLPRRGKPCQGQGKVNCVEPRTSLFLWLPLTIGEN